MDTANNSSLIVDQLITFADWFFPGDVDFDRDLDLGGISNGTESCTPTAGMRKWASHNDLSDQGESPPQGSSPKPATRRKNKPAPTPPTGNTPDKSQAQQSHQAYFESKRPDDKPPPAPDKPPRPLVTSTLNRATYKNKKHDQVTAELIQLHSQLQTRDSTNGKVQDKSVVSSKTSESDSKLNPFESVSRTDHIKA